MRQSRKHYRCNVGSDSFEGLCKIEVLPMPCICRVRISLGLKPLVMESEKEQRQKEALAREAKRAEEEKEAKAAELAERVKAYVSIMLCLHASCLTLPYMRSIPATWRSTGGILLKR